MNITKDITVSSKMEINENRSILSNSTTLINFNPKITSTNLNETVLTGYEKNKFLFWCFASVCLCVALVTITGNGIVIVVSGKKRNMARLKHFDGIVKSLAVTDFLFGVIGVPLIVVNYYLVGDRKIQTCTFEEEMMKLLPNILTTCNCIHIVYLVYLRHLAITKAIKCKSVKRDRHRNTILAMWMTSILANIVPPLAAKIRIENIGTYFLFISRLILLHGFHTIPVILIITFYGKMIRKVNENNVEKMKRVSQASGLSRLSTNDQKTPTKMIKGVAICLIICYLPYLLWWQYSMIVFRADGGRDGGDSKTSEVIFAALSRLLMLINSSLNPFIYASTIPAFKLIVKRYMSCKFDDTNMEESGVRRTISLASRNYISTKSNFSTSNSRKSSLI